MNRTLLASLTVKVAEKSMDMLIRATILEGVAGVPRGTWIGRGDMGGITRAFEKAQETLPGMDLRWVSRGEVGLHRLLEATVGSLLRKWPDAVDDVVMQIMSSFGTKSAESGNLYKIGRLISDEVRSGSDVKHAAGMLRVLAKSRAMDYLRQRKTRPEESLSMETEDGGTRELDIANEVNSDKLLDILLDPRNGAIRDHYINTAETLFRGRRQREDGSPKPIDIVRYWLEHPEKKNVEISRDFGFSVSHGAATYVGGILKDAQKAFLQAVENNPKIRGDVEMAMELAGLGYGIRAAKKKQAQ